MQDAYAFLAEDALHIELVDGKGAAHFACSVVPDPGRPETEAGIRDIELMTIAPGAALIDFRAFKSDIAGAKLTLDKIRHGTSFYKFCKNQALASQGGRHVQDVGFGAGGLHIE